jgi:putative spermidine/putrescine transport system permease protein
VVEEGDQPLVNGRRDGISAAAMLGPASAVVVLVMVAPLLLLARYSLNRFDPTQLMVEAVTAANYVRFFTDPFYLAAMRTTVAVAVATTALCLLLALPLSWRIARSASRWKSAMMLVTVLPLFIGSTVRSVGWMILFARGGMMDALGMRFFGRHVDLMYSTVAVIFGVVSINLPIVALTLQSVFEGIDSRLEEAARGLGASPTRAFLRVVWPLALPGVAIAAILCFILAMNAYATPVLLGGPRFQMMAPLLYWEFASNNNWPFAAALGFVLMGTTLLLTGISGAVIPRRYRS